MTGPPHIAVIIPTYRRPERLLACLRMLAGQDYPGDRFEVLVGDDAADPELPALVAANVPDRLRVRVLSVNGNHGPAAARNTAAACATGEILAFTDDDCLPAPGWLAAGAAALHRGAASCYGFTRVPLRNRPTDFELNTSGLERAGFITANCFVRSDAFLQVGGFDERFTRAWREDSDLYFSLLEHGFTVVHAPLALVLHPASPAPPGISVAQQRNNAFDALLYRKHPRLFAETFGTTAPWQYYVIVLSALFGAGHTLAGQPALALAFGACWALFTGKLFLRRIRHTSHAPAHVREMLATSVAIPFTAVFWRVYGAFRFRVVFL